MSLVREAVRAACARLGRDDPIEMLELLAIFWFADDFDWPFSAAEARAFMESVAGSRCLTSFVVDIMDRDRFFRNISDFHGPFFGVTVPSYLTLKSLYLGFSDDSIVARFVTLVENGSFPRLEKLSFRGRIGPVGAQDLAGMLTKCDFLKKLNLGCNRIGDRGCQSIVSVLEQSKLTSLNVPENELTNDSAMALAGVLERNQSCLEELDIEGEELRLDINGEDAGPSIDETGVWRIIRALRRNNTLRSIDLRWCGMSDACEWELVELLMHVNYSLEVVDLPFEPYPRERQLIENLCANNVALNRDFKQLEKNIETIPTSLWPQILVHFRDKPDRVFFLLKEKAEVLTSSLKRRKRKRPQYLRY